MRSEDKGICAGVGVVPTYNASHNGPTRLRDYRRCLARATIPVVDFFSRSSAVCGFSAASAGHNTTAEVLPRGAVAPADEVEFPSTFRGRGRRSSRLAAANTASGHRGCRGRGRAGNPTYALSQRMRQRERPLRALFVDCRRTSCDAQQAGRPRACQAPSTAQVARSLTPCSPGEDAGDVHKAT